MEGEGRSCGPQEGPPSQFSEAAPPAREPGADTPARGCTRLAIDRYERGPYMPRPQRQRRAPVPNARTETRREQGLVQPEALPPEILAIRACATRLKRLHEASQSMVLSQQRGSFRRHSPAQGN